MAGDDTTTGDAFQVLQALGAAEPCWVVSSQPALRNAIAPVLNHVAVIADEEDRSTVGQVDLHTDQTVGVAGQVVQGDALAEVEAAFVEGLPVQSQLEVVLEIDADVIAGGNLPESGSEF